VLCHSHVLPWSPVDCILPSMAAPLLPPPPDPQFVFRGPQSAVNAVHFSRGSQAQECPLLFSGSQSGLVHIWSLQIWRAVTTLDGHGGQSVTWLQLLSQGSQLHSQGRDQRLCLWDLAEGRNAVVDSVHLESVGFCRSSVLAYGQLHWTLAVPGKGTDEV
jgi:WD40 repeat protein